MLEVETPDGYFVDRMTDENNHTKEFVVLPQASTEDHAIHC